MKAEIALLPPPVPVEIVGINGIGYHADNPLMCAGRVLPWLQDDAVGNVWSRWGIAYRDVVVVDPSGRVTAIYNLTTNDLANPTYYAELKALLLAAAGP